ncbi:CPBP intramembrane metalloprotease [anaerobic digester metagenome]
MHNPFLDNGSQGKNNWWRYLLTITISWAGAILATGILVAVLMIIYYVYGASNAYQLDLTSITSNSMFFLFIVFIAYGISFLLFYICVRFMHKKKFTSLINTTGKMDWMKILKGAGIWTALIVALTFTPLLMTTGIQGYQITFNPKTFGVLLILSVLAFPIQASFEELFFRGYLMQAFGLLSKKPVIPLVTTSIVFASVHFFNGTDLQMSVMMVLGTFIVGLMLGIIVLGENRLETAMGIHIANNMFVAVVYNSTDSGLGNLPSVITVHQSDAVTGTIGILIAAVLMITILFWNKKTELLNIFKWKDSNP